MLKTLEKDENIFQVLGVVYDFLCGISYGGFSRISRKSMPNVLFTVERCVGSLVLVAFVSVHRTPWRGL